MRNSTTAARRIPDYVTQEYKVDRIKSAIRSK